MLQTHRLRGLDEDLGAPHLVLVLVHVDRVQQMENPLLLLATPRGPRLFGEDRIPEKKQQGLTIASHTVLRNSTDLTHKQT